MARYEDHVMSEDSQSHGFGGGTSMQASHQGYGTYQQEPHMSSTASNGSSSPVRTPPNQALPSLAAKRKSASEFLKSTTGKAPPYATDQSFRAALQDGVLLCRLANTLWPGTIPQVLEAHDVEHGPSGLLAQRNHNCNAFLAAVQQQLRQVPADCLFTIADLEAEHEERPQVTTCLLHLRALAAARQVQHPHQQQQQQQQQTHAAAAGEGTSSPLHLHDQQYGLRSSVDPFMVTPPSQRSSSRLQQQQQQHVQQQQQQQQHYGMVTPASIAPPFSHSTPGTRAPLYGAATPGTLGSVMRSSMSNLPLALPSPSPLREGHSGLSQSAGGGASGSPAGGNNMLALRASSGNGALVPGGGGGGGYITAATNNGVQAAAGVTKLMQQCTSMLKERMFPGEAARYSPAGGGAGPDSAMKALGPVLEGVLGQLTEEYERRLLTKDHELSRVQEARNKAQEQMHALQAQMEQLQRDVDEHGAAAARATAEASAADVELLRKQLADAQAALADRERELAQARAALSSADSARADAFLALQGEAMMLRTRLGELLQIDERYKRVLLENRELYNTVQDLRGNIRVYCRIRPPGATGDLSPSCVDVGLEGDLAVYDQASGTKRVFKVDRVFDQGVSQGAVYDDTQPLIRSVLDGYNVCIFAYGQTGSGKTHTMSGTHTEELAGRGINFRALDDLFAIRDARSGESEFTFRVQMLEIYNEVLRDLLVDGRSGGQNRLDILATQASGCNVPGATQVEVHTASDVVSLMAHGAAHRATSETKMNDRSSRSHQILTVIVDGFNSVTKASSHGCLHLIDLAGSERVGKSEASGDRLVEAQHINKSLSALGDVMAALAAKTAHVPYRNSKLTQLLQDSLQGNAKVMMFMHVSPEANMFGETVSTLKFATRVSQITLGQAKKNVVSGKVFEAHEEVVRHQRDMECKEQQLQQLQAALEHHRAREAALEAELQHLRQQQPAGGAATGQLGVATTLDTGSHSTMRQRSSQPQLQLPLQQMLASQAAAAAAADAAGGQGLQGLSSSRGAVAAAGADPISARTLAAAAAPGSARGAAPGAAEGAPDSPTKVGRLRIDRTPPRDQDECSLPSEPSRTALDLSPLGLHLGFGGDDPTPPRTARSTRSTSSGMRASLIPQSRGSTSAARHMERLQSARHSGTYKPGAGASPASAGPVAAPASAAHSSPGSSLSHIVSRVAAAIGSSRASASSKARDVAAAVDRAPQTSRVGGVAAAAGASRAGPEPSGIPGFTTARQGGVYGGGGRTASGTSGAATARGAATSRGGSRWK